MQVFSLEHFKKDKRITRRSLRISLRSGWPQECDGKPVEEVRKVYKILPEWTVEKKEQQPK
ncbi:hypothetical protein SDC9_59755 [bioreactor metagenome]|uniref:Uncharacterized protein n=1 Tax=bioreactor metagenome TaxID=1076179 RepID=A0A644XC87_9ZZZZ